MVESIRTFFFSAGGRGFFLVTRLVSFERSLMCSSPTDPAHITRASQAFLIKLRPTQERTIDSLALELPYNVATPPSPSSNSSSSSRRRPRWRHMKHACGENIRRVYSQTRLDLAWNFRNAYAEATKLKRAQDRFCERALEAHAKGLYLQSEGSSSSSAAAEEFPDDLKQEALVDVLRGKVKVRFRSIVFASAFGLPARQGELTRLLCGTVRSTRTATRSKT